MTKHEPTRTADAVVAAAVAVVVMDDEEEESWRESWAEKEKWDVEGKKGDGIAAFI